MDDNQEPENEQHEEIFADDDAAEDDEPEQEEGPARNEDGSLNGGVAVPPNAEGVTKSPSECDLVCTRFYVISTCDVVLFFSLFSLFRCSLSNAWKRWRM